MPFSQSLLSTPNNTGPVGAYTRNIAEDLDRESGPSKDTDPNGRLCAPFPTGSGQLPRRRALSALWSAKGHDVLRKLQ